MGRVAERFPEKTGIEAYFFGFGGVNHESVGLVRGRVQELDGVFVHDPKTIDGFAPLVPGQSGNGVGDVCALLKTHGVDTIGDKMGTICL